MASSKERLTTLLSNKATILDGDAWIHLCDLDDEVYQMLWLAWKKQRQVVVGPEEEKCAYRWFIAGINQGGAGPDAGSYGADFRDDLFDVMIMEWELKSGTFCGKCSCWRGEVNGLSLL